MNRIDRLFGILLLLQRKSRIRADDIAEQYDITVRTVYRDIAALHELGVPIISITGEGYRLMEGFYLPPLIFTKDEASALFLAGRLFEHQTEGNLTADITTALTKVNNILPKPTLFHIEQLTEIIHFTIPERKLNFEDRRLLQVQQAILENRVIHIAYHSLKDDSRSERDIEPRQLTYGNNAWYISAYCRLRQDIREFRLDRIDQFVLTANTFTPQTPTQKQQETIEVRIRMHPEQVRWVKERQHYGFVNQHDMGNHIVMTYHIHQFSEIKAWILAWGAKVQVTAPDELVNEIREEIKQLLQLLT